MLPPQGLGVNGGEDHRGRADRAAAHAGRRDARRRNAGRVSRPGPYRRGDHGGGEADTAPLLAKTIVEMPSSHSIARGLREVLVGDDPLQVDRLWQRMFHASDHYGRRGAALHAISAIDIALWDIAGKAAGRAVSELLGGRRLERVPVYASEVMPDTPRGGAAHRRPGRRDRLPRPRARLGAARPRPRLRRGARARRPGGARHGADTDARWWPRLHSQASAGAAAAGGGAQPLLVRGGAAAGRPRRLQATRGGAAVRIAAGEADETAHRSARSWSVATSTSCSPISPAAAVSPSPGRSRCWSGHPRSRSCRTASRQAFSSPLRCTSSRRSIGRPGPSTRSRDSPLVNGILQRAVRARGRVPCRSRRARTRRRTGPGRDCPLPSGLVAVAAIEFAGSRSGSRTARSPSTTSTSASRTGSS